MKYVSAQDATRILRDVFNKPGGSFRVTFDAACGEGAPAAQPVTVITLRHAPAMDTSDLIDRVFRGRLSVTPDPRTNSLIIRADKATLVEVESLLLKLDVDTPAPPVRKADK